MTLLFIIAIDIQITNYYQDKVSALENYSTKEISTSELIPELIDTINKKEDDRKQRKMQDDYPVL